MTFDTELYSAQTARWPKTGRHILAQFDDESVVVYQAYRPAIGRFAAEHGYFGGEFSLSRMSWIKRLPSAGGRSTGFDPSYARLPTAHERDVDAISAPAPLESPAAALLARH